MSYLVLARKYRPQNFEEMIGQGHIAELLKQAITSGRIAHAYLFSGPRGVGKTSCARILAKALNCAKGPTLKPCDECSACREITKGNSFDVLEIDGASNRGIDEIRTLRENVKFAPSYGRYKIYIVDEVHMLTTEAFNALLKTLEEPPEHVKFIFATTNPNKLPATIISRCQRFDFKRIATKELVDTIKDVCRKEKITIEDEAAYAIAKASSGSLRDCLSVLDQLSALSDKGVKAADVTTMLGMVELQIVFDLATAIGAKNASQALALVDEVLDKGKDVKQLIADLIEHWRNLLIIKIGGKSLGRLVDHPGAVKEMLLKQCASFDVEQILGCIDSLIEAKEQGRITESLRMPLEVAIIKLTLGGKGSFAQPKDATKEKFSVNNQKGQVDLKVVDEPLTSPTMTVEGEVGALEPAGTLEIGKITRAWDTLTHAVSKEKMSLATFLQEGVPQEVIGTTVIIGFPPTSTFQKEVLEGKENVRIVERIFSHSLRATVHVEYRIIKDITPKEEDTIVKSALDTFKGKVVSRWHNDGDS